MDGLIKLRGKTQVGRLASIHVRIRLCVYVLCLGSGHLCGAEFFHWPMSGEGRASTNHLEAARSGEGARATWKDAVSSINRSPVNIIYSNK